MLGYLTTACFFLLLIWGNLVAGLHAGLGCPDWPLCFSSVVPPYRWDTYMEFGHRVIAAISTFLLLALVYKRYKAYSGSAKAIPIAAIFFVAIEITLGGLVVLKEIPVDLTTIHFALGLCVFMLCAYMTRFDGETRKPVFEASGASGLLLLVLALAFAQATLGAYVRHSKSGLACPDFPACLGSLIPPVFAGQILVHFTHRVFGYALAVTLFLAGVSILSKKNLSDLKPQIIIAVALILIQIAVGAGVVLSRLHYSAAALHLGIAVLIMLVIGNMWAVSAEKSAR